MTEMTELLIDGLKSLECATGATINFRGVNYPCVGGAEARGKKLELAGFQFHSDCPIVVRASVFGEGCPPHQKQELAYSSGPGALARTWRVDEVRTLWTEIIVLECNDPTQ